MMKTLPTYITSIFLLLSASLFAEEPKRKEIKISVTIDYPESEELAALKQSIPKPEDAATSYADWKASFLETMHYFIQLLEHDDKIHGANWTADIDDCPDQP